MQIGGDAQGPIVAGDLTVQVVTAQPAPPRPIDDRAVLAADVARYRRRNRSMRPTIMAEHPAVSVLFDRLSTMGARQVLVVHGRAGVGKSSAVTDALEQVRGVGWTVGVVRMDAVDQVVRSAAALGATVNLPESPLLVLDRVGGDGPRVLVVDQLDAVSLYSGRMPDSYDAVLEMLEQAANHPQVKIVLVVRTVDLTADPRMRSLLADTAHVDTLEIGELAPEAVRAALLASGVDVSVLSSTTLTLLQTPLHLAVFSRLDSTSQQLAYRTLPDLYQQFTNQVRQAVEREPGAVNLQTIIAPLLLYMSDHETLQAPAGVLDQIPQSQVSALVSAGILVEDGARVSFFHETYFDFHFARAFVAQGRDLHDFLVDSGQQLFRRAQARQVLEHLAGLDRRQFRNVTVRLLTSDVLRSHLMDVVVGVLSQLDATAEDWTALEPLAFGTSRRSTKLVALLAHAVWFDAADQAGRWDRLLADPGTVDAAAHQLIIAARVRPQRVAQLVRPYVGASEAWNHRLRAMVQWSLNPGLADLTVELMEAGILDDIRGPLAVNSDFWSILYGIRSTDPIGAARIIGAYLRRAQTRAQNAGSPDPFTAGYIGEHSSAGGASAISTIAAGAPQQFLQAVLPFLDEVIRATGTRDHSDGLLHSPRWGHRYLGPLLGVDQALFAGVETALQATVGELLAAEDDLIATLAISCHEEMRFLACRAYTAAAELADAATCNVALDWLLSDPRNLRLGWIDSPRWATRQLIEAATPHCDQSRLIALCDKLLDHYPGWETTPAGLGARGRSQYELLTAIHAGRRPDTCARRIAELSRKFADPPPPPQNVEMYIVGSPVPDTAAPLMTDEDWRRAIAKHRGDHGSHRGDGRGGAWELAQLLGRHAPAEPERFARLALTFDAETPAAHTVAVIDAVADKIPLALLSELCVHARRIADRSVGLSVCRAVQKVAATANETLVGMLEHYSRDPDPDREWARTTAENGQLYYNGDLDTAGKNGTRGQAAEAIARVLVAQPTYAGQLTPTIMALASDPVLAVRTQTAMAIHALLQPHPDAALDLADQLLAESPDDILTSSRTIELLTAALLCAPQRFTTHLARALNGPPTAAELAGQAWAVALVHDRLDPAITSDPTVLPAAARRGAARMLATAPQTRPDLITILFDDPESTVRRTVAAALHHLNDVDAATRNTLIVAFTTSTAFATHYDTLFHTVEASTHLLPDEVLPACNHAIDIAGRELADISTSGAAAVADMITIILRLYRQSHASIRSQCLDTLDKLSDLNAIGLEDALAVER